jgi:hypothetical protein
MRKNECRKGYGKLSRITIPSVGIYEGGKSVPALMSNTMCRS